MLRRKIKDPPDKLIRNILLYNNCLPSHFYNTTNIIKTNSWFNIHEKKAILKCQPIKTTLENDTNEIIKCKTVTINFTPKQKTIMYEWFKGYTEMYNKTVLYIRRNYPITRHNITKNFKFWTDMSFYNLRTKMTTIRNDIVKRYNIYTHILDTAIRQVANNISSAKSNIKNGNIKFFKLRYWSENRNSKTIEIEPSYIRNNKICYPIFGDINYTYNNEDYKLNNVKKAVKINYNKQDNKYKLFIPYSIQTEIKEKTNKTISLDPGLRTFMTGISEEKSIKIGDKVNFEIGKYMKRLNGILGNDKINSTTKKKNERQINNKIKNKIDDLHWKTIKYLTSNYDYICLGDMSSRDIVNNSGSVLSGIQKASCLRTKYYVFQERLQFKCLERGVSYKLIDERNTSKTCSQCGSIKQDLGKAEIYECQCCKVSLDRDINGARNIFLKNDLKK